MILLSCLWHHGSMRVLSSFLAWPVVHYSMVFCLQYVAVSGHVSGCCCKKVHGKYAADTCHDGLVASVRAVLTFLHSVIMPFWGLALLAGGRFDVESHSFLQICALSFYAYSTYWYAVELINYCPKKIRIGSARYGTVPIKRPALVLRLMYNSFSLASVLFTLLAVDREMTQWGSSVIPILMDLQPSSSWKNPTPTQRRTLAYHLLSKTSEVSWILTAAMCLQEAPNLFHNLVNLIRMQKNQSRFRAQTWTRDGATRTNAELAAAIGAAAWRRESGGLTGRGFEESEPESAMESFLIVLHTLTFAALRVVAGFLLLRRLLNIADVVQDTTLLSALLLTYALGLYQFGGVVCHSAKRMTCEDYRRLPRQSLSWRIITCCNDDWLN